MHFIHPGHLSASLEVSQSKRAAGEGCVDEYVMNATLEVLHSPTWFYAGAVYAMNYLRRAGKKMVLV